MLIFVVIEIIVLAQIPFLGYVNQYWHYRHLARNVPPFLQKVWSLKPTWHSIFFMLLAEANFSKLVTILWIPLS